MTARPARPDELRPAFELLFSRLSSGEREYRTSKALELVASGELDARGVLVAPGGVFICQAVPGAGGLVWPPVAASPDAEDRLIRAGLAWLREQGARLAQCLLAEDESSLSPSLLRNGFTEVTGLTYLRHELRLDARHFPVPSRLRLECYDSARPGEFHSTLLRSYEQSLDCPEVNGARAIDDVISGHQAQGRYDPSRWWLARSEGAPVGVLLIVEPSRAEWEVAYMGVVPEARRRGVGRELLLRSLCEARVAEAVWLVLSVDDRNLPARALYQSVGFEPYDHRRVLLAFWGG
jgi:ribosomal protein S18 acetylase RimI-like enzyme